MKKSITLFLILLFFVPSHAQKLYDKMNDIKLDDSYLWEHCLMASADSAYKYALISLVSRAREELGVDLSADKVRPLVKQIKKQRGESTQVFVYVRKDQIVFKPLPLAQRIVEKPNLESAWYYMESQKGSLVKKYGKLKDVIDTNSVYLAIFSQSSQTPICVLSPVKYNGKRQNMIDGREDSLDNYHQCYAIWFTLNE